MTKNKRIFIKVVRIALPLLLTLLWLGFIYGNSLKDGAASGEQSGQVHKIVNEVAQSVGVEKPISERFVRKGAHFTEFAVLGLLICADLWALGVVSLKKKLYFSAPLLLCSVPICAIFASFDELLQRFTPQRGPSIADVLLDTSGAAASSAVFIICFIIIFFIYQNIVLKNNTRILKSNQPL